ncbi:MAG: DNA ligase D [Candidatus Eisenbacteria bacterium]|uniref:DNA ligase (ATP) n=1 Tax=Eiseniibacteriota bacterium TaxID=2212470 RepID=A0A538TJG6_UNCEI|nr:MAG: DNA ligase D [Candidatus Eisenbacteria bacterium]
MSPRTGAPGKSRPSKPKTGALKPKARGAAKPKASPTPKPKAPPAPAPLETYRRKRDPGRTTEPFGGVSAARAPSVATSGGQASRFVVQQHWARNMHFDLRLELEGVLKSWAVPKGPSLRAEEKRLAVHVEDHPIEYANFEGVIPAGNYGAGSVIVWDRGGYGSFKPEDIREQYARGKLELELFGHKLGGRWTLVRMSKSEKDWLLLKKADSAASEQDVLERWPRSVISGLTVQEMRDVPGWTAALRARVDSLKAPRGDLRADKVQHMLATSAEKPFSRAGWVFEIKYDGVRVIAERRGEEVRMLGRSGEDITARYPEIAAALHGLTAEHFVVDGEIVAYDASGRPSFGRLQKRMLLSRPHDIAAAMARVPVRAVFFDCLALEGHDLRKLRLLDRKECLARILPPAGIVQASDHIAEHGEAFFNAASEMGLEGMIAKRADSAYTGKRSSDWVKIKCQRRQEFVIGGYAEPRGGDRHFGALHVGVYEGDQLRHVTRVGSGFDGAMQDHVWQLLQPLARAESPFGTTGPTGRGNHWVEPKLVCEVRFTEWTADGGVRHPIFIGLRTDRKPEEIRREGGPESDAAPEPDDADSGTGPGSSAGPPSAPTPAAEPREVRLSNLRKAFWPDEGYTKGDLVAYYDTIAPLMLPYLRDRPVVLTRYPDGIKGKSFFQKDAPVFVPDWMRIELVYSKDSDRDIRFFVLDDEESLRYVANLGTIPIHMWSARSGSLERPDWLVLDLDPKGAPFSHVVEIARSLHRLLEELELPSYPKTSGQAGLHILIPLGRRYTHEECKTFARVLASLALEANPEIATLARPLHARGGKVYVDWGQNGHGITIVAPFSLRPIPGAPASCPLQWSEVNGKLDPAKFTIRTLPKRFEKMEDPLAGVMGKGVNIGVAIAAIEERLKRKAKRK